ncbi:hypothetical protein [Virgibacillus ainsalahensis]
MEKGRNEKAQETRKNKKAPNERVNSNVEDTVKSERVRFKNADKIYE